ncbi:uncharacterized protein F5Z01DRAFT_5430 [Emericellopsis atlantica]|uniref:Uncharacterized protein n=1 Tax=Emericellopsis atlantica TaxID=2614577 RepID=A0A9P7ZV15_9HYPO|nr:uncharacterized protein F5Z01DRAFT_5430 [Emericellopsis atlantica]KAG9258849.1 hypothetical protein F5Z01DRAFT_5430 [Emericellopsis atlantica]
MLYCRIHLSSIRMRATLAGRLVTCTLNCAYWVRQARGFGCPSDIRIRLILTRRELAYDVGRSSCVAEQIGEIGWRTQHEGGMNFVLTA